jgi:flagellar protein FliS
MMLQAARGLKQYQQVRVDADVSEADPHRLVQLLYLGFLERVAKAKGLIDANDIASKGKVITEAMGIIQYLRGTLDMEKGGDISQNLSDLYEYIERRLMEANLNNDKDILNEIAGLVVEIKAGWDVISA